MTGKSYELGLKSGFLGGALTTTVSVFRIQQDNLAQPDTGFNIPATNPLGVSQRLTQGSYAVVGLMGRYEFSDQVRAKLNVDNVLDEKYYSQIGFFDQYAYGAPRNFNLSLTYRF